MANTSIEIQGYRIRAVDNGDGTFSLSVTDAPSGATVTVEFEGIRLKIAPLGVNDTVTGEPLYALVVNP